MRTYCWDDHEREEGTLTRVEKYADGSYAVTSDSGWSCGVSAEYGIEPHEGDAFVTWGSIGRPIRGQAINGAVLYYRTPDEQKIEDAKAVEKMKADRVAEYEGKRSDFDARVLALPDPLRLRVEDFRAHGGDEWRWSFESYEVFCCEEAVKIHARFPSSDGVRALQAMPYDKQKVAFPEMSSDHSGNTWGMSCLLAAMLVDRPELLSKMHGALCPLVGCEDYGCFAGREKTQESPE